MLVNKASLDSISDIGVSLSRVLCRLTETIERSPDIQDNPAISGAHKAALDTIGTLCAIHSIYSDQNKRAGLSLDHIEDAAKEYLSCFAEMRSHKELFWQATQLLDRSISNKGDVDLLSLFHDFEKGIERDPKIPTTARMPRGTEDYGILREMARAEFYESEGKRRDPSWTDPEGKLTDFNTNAPYSSYADMMAQTRAHDPVGHIHRHAATTRQAALNRQFQHLHHRDSARAM